MENKTEGVYTPLFLYYNYKKHFMDKGKLKEIITSLKLIVESLESEVMSDTESYLSHDTYEVIKRELDYDEIFEDDEWMLVL